MLADSPLMCCTQIVRHSMNHSLKTLSPCDEAPFLLTVLSLKQLVLAEFMAKFIKTK